MSDLCGDCGRPFDKAASKYCDRKTEHKEADIADIIVEDIEFELTDRRGIGDEFEGCDVEIQQEMRNAWSAIVRKHLENQ